MRTSLRSTILAVLLGLILSGCLGGDGDDDDSKDGDGPGAVDPAANEFLSISVRAEPSVAGAWFEPGDELNVEAVAPPNAVGNITYTWAIQPDPFSDYFAVDAGISTGEIQPGESMEMTFDRPGFYEAGHCGPHAWMKHSVAVVEGYESPAPVTVYMLEGDLSDQDTYRFSPQHITIGTGETVTYVNIGAVMHTAEITHEGEAVPTPTKLPIEGASGSIPLEGASWRNILVFAEDEAGNTGYGKLDVYVREKFGNYSETSSGTFNSVADPAQEFTHTFEWTGDITLEVTVEDPTEALQKIDVTLALDGSDDDPIISETAIGSTTLTGRITTAIARDYVLTVAPSQGFATSFSIAVSIAYDYAPPPRGDDLPCPEPHYSLGHC